MRLPTAERLLEGRAQHALPFLDALHFNTLERNVCPGNGFNPGLNPPSDYHAISGRANSAMWTSVLAR